MKKHLKTTLLLSLIALAAYGCGKTTTTNTKKSSSSSSSSSSTPTDSGVDPDPSTVEGCPGVYRSGASRCYFTEIPKLIFSGTSTSAQPLVPVNNVQIWSSATGLPSTFSPNNLATDATFKVRIKPTTISSGSSQQGKQCSGPMAYNWTRLKVYFMLRRQGDSLTTIYETSASVNTYSPKLALPVISGTTAPYILEVMGVESDHRCNAAYGSLSTNEKTACTNGTFWGTIPLNQGGPTSCVALNIEFSTDTTYDLP